MHELTLCSNIVAQVRQANHGSLDNITQIIIKVGELALVDVESLQFWFGVVIEKAGYVGISLNIETVVGKAKCGSCLQIVWHRSLYDICPQCGSMGDFTILEGQELLIKSFSKG